MGYSIDRFVDQLAEDLKCGICHNIFEQAVDTQCGHTFCCQCLDQWLFRPVAIKRCPKCSKPMPFRDRLLGPNRRNQNAVIIGGNFMVNTNRRLNAMVSKLSIRCDYQWNGCLEVCPLVSLSIHLAECPHRKCRTCGQTGADFEPKDHNCVEVLLKDNDLFKGKYEVCEQSLKTLKAKTSELMATILNKSKTKMATNDCPKRNALILSTSYIKIGKLWTSKGSIEWTDEGIKMPNILPFGGQRPVHFEISFGAMSVLSLRAVPSLGLIRQRLYIRLIAGLMKKIQDLLNLGTDSKTNLLPKESEDPIEYHIEIQLSNDMSESVAKELTERCNDVNNSLISKQRTAKKDK